MNRIQLLLTLALLPSIVVPAQAREANPKPELESAALTVRFYDYVKVDPAIRDRALADAARVLENAGLHVRFLDCPLTMEELARNPACNADIGPADLLVRILPPSMHPPVSNTTHTYGFAVVKDQAHPRFASILYQNVERLAFERDTESRYTVVHRSMSHNRYTGLLLGHVIAHEIGHLLLATNRHSKAGLMRAHWSPKDLAEAITGRLAFGDKEVAVIRENVHGRHAASN